MARINTNVPALVAQRTLRTSQRDLQISLERLSTGLRINRGADDPAGLINSEHLRAEIAGVSQAISNSQRAISIIATTEGALNEVSALLIDIQGLIVATANDAALSTEEKEANQLQIDSAIESISRIANTTTFAGRTLLNGELDYVMSGVSAAALATVHAQSVQFGTTSFIPVEVIVTTSAQKAELRFNSAVVTGSAVQIEIRGNDGVTSFQWQAGVTHSQIVQAVNLETQATGVEAYIFASGAISGVGFRSIGYGSDQFVEIQSLPSGPELPITNVNNSAVKRDDGRDAAGTINGASVTGRGLELNLNTRTLDLSLTLNESLGLGTTSFAITGGGALFQLGPDVTPNQQVNIGVGSVVATRLGDTNVGFLNQIMEGGAFEVSRGPVYANGASKIINKAMRQVGVLRGRLGAFERNTLQPNISSLSITMENLTASESAMRDTDFAVETSRLTRNQILVSAGTSVLALANSSAQNVLALLGG